MYRLTASSCDLLTENTLPGERAQATKLFVHKLRRAGFDGAHEIRDGRVGSPAEVHVDVIFDSTDIVERPLLRSDDAADVRIQILGDVRGNPRLAAPGAENDVQQNLRVSAGHRDSFAAYGASRTRRLPRVARAASPRRRFTRGYIPSPLPGVQRTVATLCERVLEPPDRIVDPPVWPSALHPPLSTNLQIRSKYRRRSQSVTALS